ncbi:hypothetical protein HKD37_08G021645 [Glycine soja]
MLSCSLMDSMTCRQPKPDGVEATVELPMVSSLPTVFQDCFFGPDLLLCFIRNNLGSDFGGGELPAAFGAVVGTSGRSLRRCSRVAGNGKESAAEGGRVGTIEFYYGGCIMRLCTLD